MVSLLSRLKRGMFGRLAIKTTLSIIGLGILLFVFHTNPYLIPFSDSGQFLKTINQVYAADMTPSGEQVHPPASGLPPFERRQDGYEFIVAVLLTFLGIITIFLGCWRWKKKDLALLSFGAFCLLWGARYAPMATMAGDFYDFLVIDENRIGVLVADVSGHGVPASLIASMVKIAFVSQTPHAADPARVLGGLNQMLCGKLESDFVTAGYLFIDTEQQSAAYAGAGHPPLLLHRQRENEILEITEKSIILGQVDDTEFKNSRLKLEQGDRFVLYTDGIVEALNPAGEIFGTDRFKAFIKSNSALTIDLFCDRLLDTIADWAGGGSKGSRDDDLTLLAIDYEAAVL